MIFSGQQQGRKIRQSRHFVPANLGETGAHLEPRRYAAYFYRLAPNPFGLTAGIGNGGFGVDPPGDSDTEASEALASVAYSAHNANTQWSQGENLTNQVVDSGSYNNSATNEFYITVDHEAQGNISTYGGSDPATGDAPGLYASFATSGTAPDGTVTPISWQLANSGAGGAPTTGDLPSGETIQITFTAFYNANNPQNFSAPTLEIDTNLITVTVNVGTAGLLITNSADGSVLYSNSGFGRGETDDTVTAGPFDYTLATTGTGPFEVDVAYGSTLASPLLAVQQNPTDPDHSWYQDSFVWSLDFKASK